MPLVRKHSCVRPFQPLAGLALGLALLRPAVAGRLPLAAVQEALGCTGRVVNADSIDIGDGTNRVRLFPGLRRSEVNGSVVWLHAVAEPAGNDSLVTLDARDVRDLLLPLLRAQPPPSPRPLRVMLDPGHGGEDSGAVAERPALAEKELVLDLARRIGRRLETAGLAVGYTRTNDCYLGLDERTATAGVWKADAFVSLHANFAENRQAVGPETFVLPIAGYAATGGDQHFSPWPRNGNSNDVGNTLLGYSIHRRLPGRAGDGDRGLRRARFQVLRQAGCPAVLVEVGFLSNAEEARLLAGSAFRDRLADAVADGVLEYARHTTVVVKADAVVTGAVAEVKTLGECCATEEQGRVEEDPAEKLVEPVNKVEPVDPDSVKPVEPVDPVKPVEPLESVKPVEPLDPVKPVEPLESVKPVEPVESVKPVEPLESVKPVEPVETVEPVEPVGAVDTAETVE